MTDINDASQRPLRILVDNTVLQNGITHETAQISTGPQKWGHLEVQSGYLARIPVNSPDHDGRQYRETRYLPGIADLARHSRLELLTSAELIAERTRQPAGSFEGYGWYDHNIFEGLGLVSVDGLPIHVLFPDSAFLQRHGLSLKDLQKNRINSCTDPLFVSLVKLLGEKSSFDAYHIVIAEKAGLFCFLHMDFPLAEKVKQNRRRTPIFNLKTEVLLPSQLAGLLGIGPVDTNLLTTPADSGLPTHPELHWERQRREPRRGRSGTSNWKVAST